jgi:thiol peroxidase
MANITLNGTPITTNGELPKIGETLHPFNLIAANLSEMSNKDYYGKCMLLNIFPSVDTGTCALSVREFNKKAAKLMNVHILCISKDLPFALKRFCGAEGIENLTTLSTFRSNQFDYLLMNSGPLAGLLSRAIITTNAKGEILYTEQVQDIVNEPNYEAALQSFK